MELAKPQREMNESVSLDRFLKIKWIVKLYVMLSVVTGGVELMEGSTRRAHSSKWKIKAT